MYSIFNGRMFRQGIQNFDAGNLAFRSGVGLIESIRLENGSLPYWEAHYQRLSRSCELLKWPAPLPEAHRLLSWIRELIYINEEAGQGKLRIQAFPDQHRVNLLIELFPVPSIPAGLKKVGLAEGVCVYPDGFSALKTSSRMAYHFAAGQAKEKGWYDALLLNGQGRIAESTIANIFWEAEGQIFTPPLTEGCVAGIGRSMVLSGKLQIKPLAVSERLLYPSDLTESTPVWLVNAVRGVQPVQVDVGLPA